MATSTPPASSARYSVWPGCAKPASWRVFFLDGIGHHAGNLPGKGELGGTLDRLQGCRRVDWVGMAGLHRDAQSNRQDRQRCFEDKTRVRRLRDFPDSDVEAELGGESAQAGAIVDGKERPRTAPAQRPGFQGEFAADARRLAHRHGERRGGGHDGCLTSMVAWRRRSRM
jgi:hypothetical protein